MRRAVFLLVASMLISRPLHTEPLSCLVEKHLLEQERGFGLNDPDFSMKYRRYFRRLTECGF